MYKKPPQSNKFKPGQSGNPNGRPKHLDESDMIEMIQKIIKLYADAKSNDKTLRHITHQKIIKLNDVLLSF
ncbi:MAG: hypothetical protein JW985_02965 [Alphaproteobacteria bacterium]|nr:hypothetical protein [Alphaproteobacteria bacterium]